LSNVVAIAAGGQHSLALSTVAGLNQPNTPPFWAAPLPAQTMYELTTNVLVNTATDTNYPPQRIFYTSPASNPSWASINLTNGVITLTPNTNGIFFITTVATDNGYPPLGATNVIRVNVLPPAGPPFWLANVPSQTNYIITEFSNLTVTNTATDTNVPPNVLSYVLLVTPAVTNAAIGSNTGIITWTPQVPGDYTFTTVVTGTNPDVPSATPLSATNSFTVTVLPVAPINITISSITSTNIGGTNGLLLTWFAPSNDLFQVQWTPTLAPAIWSTFTNPPAVSYNTNFPASATNAQFNFFDDGSQAPFGSTRFYRLLLLQAANVLAFPAPTNLTVNVGGNIIVTNVATDSSPTAVLTYILASSPAGASINSTNGVITWTNATPPGLAARFTTAVSDDGTPAAYATNTFTVFVAPFPSITNVTVTATNTVLAWAAPTNDTFNVRWTTNLASPVIWTAFLQTASSTNGIFTFTDTNAPFLLKFYQLILLP